MDEMDAAERVVADRSLPPRPARLARGRSWPVAWHQVDGFAVVLFVQRSAVVARWRRPRFDLLVAELDADDGGPWVCGSATAVGPGLRDDPFTPAPGVDGLLDGGTAVRVVAGDDGGPARQHAFGWGRAGARVGFVELRTQVESVRIPVIDDAGYFAVIAQGGDPSLLCHPAPDGNATAP